MWTAHTPLLFFRYIYFVLAFYLYMKFVIVATNLKALHERLVKRVSGRGLAASVKGKSDYSKH